MTDNREQEVGHKAQTILYDQPVQLAACFPLEASCVPPPPPSSSSFHVLPMLSTLHVLLISCFVSSRLRGGEGSCGFFACRRGHTMARRQQQGLDGVCSPSDVSYILFSTETWHSRLVAWQFPNWATDLATDRKRQRLDSEHPLCLAGLGSLNCPE